MFSDRIVSKYTDMDVCFKDDPSPRSVRRAGLLYHSILHNVEGEFKVIDPESIRRAEYHLTYYAISFI